MDKALAFAMAALLLFGCIGVPQQQYDALKSSCDSDKAGITSALNASEARIGDLTQQKSDCEQNRLALSQAMDSQGAQINALKNDSATLSLARNKAAVIAQYRLVRTYYDDAFGPGKVANFARLNTVEQQVGSLNDTQLMASWKAVRYCQGLTDCADAEAAFTAMIDDKVTQIALNIAEIVK
jgi:hypothetical protein